MLLIDTFWLIYISVLHFNINKFIPAKSGMFGSWPWSRSFLTWSWSPLMDATCKGVSPRSFLCCLERFRSSSGVGAAELKFWREVSFDLNIVQCYYWCFCSLPGGASWDEICITRANCCRSDMGAMTWIRGTLSGPRPEPRDRDVDGMLRA